MTTIQKAMLVMLASLAGYVTWGFISGYEEVSAGLARIGFSGFLFLLLLSLINYLLRFVRWHWMLSEVSEVKVPISKHLLCYLSGFALTATPGKVGEAMRSYYLKPYGIKVSDSLGALFFERILDVLTILIIGALALVEFSAYRGLGIFVLAFVFAVAVLFETKIILRILLYIQRVTKNPKLTKLCSHAINLVESISLFMTWKSWVGGILLGLIAWGAEAWGFALLVQWLTGDSHLLVASGIYALSMLVGAVSFLPGGIGGAEVVMASLLTAVGLSFADATTATIICRAVTLWFAVILGLAVMAKLQMKAAPGTEV